MSQKSSIPNRLIFSPDSPKKRKRTFLLVAVLGVVQLCLIWPIYPLFSSPTPTILGFPLSFAWVILMVLVSFVSLLTYFLLEHRGENN